MVEWQPIETAPKDRPILMCIRLSRDVWMSSPARFYPNRKRPVWKVAGSELQEKSPNILGWKPIPEREG